jgi:hypothetical protein
MDKVSIVFAGLAVFLFFVIMGIRKKLPISELQQLGLLKAAGLKENPIDQAIDLFQVGIGIKEP